MKIRTSYNTSKLIIISQTNVAKMLLIKSPVWRTSCRSTSHKVLPVWTVVVTTCTFACRRPTTWATAIASITQSTIVGLVSVRQRTTAPSKTLPLSRWALSTPFMKMLIKTVWVARRKTSSVRTQRKESRGSCATWQRSSWLILAESFLKKIEMSSSKRTWSLSNDRNARLRQPANRQIQ